MNFAQIKKFDIANGVGVRVSLFVSGCTHRCKGCFNQEAWDFCYGSSFDENVENELLCALEPEYIAGLSLLGGEPFEVENQKGLIAFLEKVKSRLPHKTIWCYTGYVFPKDFVPGGRAYCGVTDKMLSLIDVLVDGPFIEEKKNISLLFRGSENQRIIDVQKSLQTNDVIIWKEEK